VQNAGGIWQRIDRLAKTIRNVIEEGAEVSAILSRILLILAEIGFDSAEEYERFQKPDFALADVTTEAFFTGGELARVLESALRRMLDERLGRT